MAKESILVICAHSDDQVIGSGGAMAKWASEGKDVIVVVASYGVKANPWLKKHVTAELRYEESQKAAEVLGIKETIFFNMEEGKFGQEFVDKDIGNKVDRIVEKHRPSKILTHSFDDPHPDHRILSKLLLKYYEDNENINIYAFHIWNPANIKKRDVPKLMIDITKTFEKKIKALKCFKSQWISMVLLIGSIYARAIISGRQAKCRYAEVFYKIK